MTAARFYINGIVQGVGFRPFIYQLACRHGLTGEVANTSAGVRIHAEGTAAGIAAFRREIEAPPPPLAVTTEIRAAPAAPAGYKAFAIAPSRGSDPARTLISPDMAVCDDCLREMHDPGDRRHRYQIGRAHV